MVSQKITKAVTPVKTGVQKCLILLDSGFRRNDERLLLWIFARISNFVIRNFLFGIRHSDLGILGNRHYGRQNPG
jgi:hypothetical protein